MTKFLIVRLGALGDIIHAIPIAAALRNRYPQAHIDWLVDARYLELLDLVQCLDRRVPIDPRDLRSGSRRAGFVQTIRDLRRVGYDACIDLQGLLKSAVLARLAGAGRTIGFPRRHLREPLARLFYSDAPDPGEATHVIGKGLSLLAPLGVEDLRIHFPISIPRTPAVESVIGRFAPAGYAIVNPCAAWPNKRWPAERFGLVAAAIRREFGLRSTVLWGPGEQPLAAAVAAASGGAAEIAPPTTIPDVIGIARHARLMISGDTGPLHIAGAVGTPIVALFGPTQPERNGPWSSLDVTVSRVSQCSCLYERQCRKAVPCIDDISVDEVIDAARVTGSPYMSDLAARLARWRVPLGFAVALSVLLFARPNWAAWKLGLAIAFVGESLRIWAAGHLEKGREVTRSGPYRWTGHPLYVGSSLIALGVAVACSSAIVAVLIFIYMGSTVTAAIRTEEAFLRRAFGDVYDLYQRSAAEPVTRRFSVGRARKNREQRAVVGLIGGFALLALKIGLRGV